MKDGDPQQRNEVIYALQSVFPNAIEGGCGWHIGKYPAQKINCSYRNISHNTVTWSYSSSGLEETCSRRIVSIQV